MNTDTLMLEKLIKSLRVDIKRDFQESLSTLEQKISTQINDIKHNFHTVQKEINCIKEFGLNQERKISLMEKQLRARNIIFFGVEERERSYEDLENIIISTLSSVMNVNCDKQELEMVVRMGRKQENRLRPIKVSFTTFGKKLSILKSKKSLKDSSIYIKEDFPPEILEKRKILRDQLIKERSEGKIAYLRYDKLVISENSLNVQKPRNKSRNPKKRVLVITPPSQPVTTISNSPKYQVSKKYKDDNITKFINKSTTKNLYLESPSVSALDENIE